MYSPGISGTGAIVCGIRIMSIVIANKVKTGGLCYLNIVDIKYNLKKIGSVK